MELAVALVGLGQGFSRNDVVTVNRCPSDKGDSGERATSLE